MTVALVSQHGSACAVLFCHLWPVSFYHIFPHYLINCTIFENKVIEHKIRILISLQFLSEIFLTL
jgi:hypothetical protein